MSNVRTTACHTSGEQRKNPAPPEVRLHAGEHNAIRWRPHSGPALLGIVTSILGPDREREAVEVCRIVAIELRARIESARAYGDCAVDALGGGKLEGEQRTVCESALTGEHLAQLVAEFIR